jgi:OPA family glycerol-3-phosphate transporter-like MFS transporter 3/OPA family glycerol-3-phosphate transporter-like MFS transporter 1/2
MIEWGTIPGGILIWYHKILISYAGIRWNLRASLIVPALWLGTIVMICINLIGKIESHTPYILYYLLVFLTGLLIGGVYNNVSGAIVIELSNMKELKGIEFNK